MQFQIVRVQMTPPGKDTVLVDLEDATLDDAKETALKLATDEAMARKDVSSISFDPENPYVVVSLIGCPAGMEKKYAPNSTLAHFVAYEKLTTDH